jgi:hypothetical protein
MGAFLVRKSMCPVGGTAMISHCPGIIAAQSLEFWCSDGLTTERRLESCFVVQESARLRVQVHSILSLAAPPQMSPPNACRLS